MRRYRYLAFSALIAALPALQGCPAVIAGGGLVAINTIEDRRTTGTQYDDSQIETRAGSRIKEKLGERAQISVTAFNRAVLLTGEAWDEAARAEAEKIAAAVPNVRSVTNEVQISGLASNTSRLNDASITASVKGRFLNVKDLNPVHVKVITEAGVVYLLGLVTEQEAETATELARTTGGVRKVVKVFEYCKSTDEQCKPAPPPPPNTPKSPRA
jgi:osmotically-inducible protein OsmY